MSETPFILKIFHAMSLNNNCATFVQVTKLQDDNRALDRLTKSKEAALLEAERTVQIALAKASMVDDLQNKNLELMKQIEICQVPQEDVKQNICFTFIDQVQNCRLSIQFKIFNYVLCIITKGREQDLG